METMILKVCIFENKKIKTYSDEIGDNIIEALNEHKNGETIKLIPVRPRYGPPHGPAPNRRFGPT